MRAFVGGLWRWVGSGVVVAALVASCGTGNPDAPGDGTMDGPRAFCATPNEGCPCQQPGLEVDCGQVKHLSGDQVSCSMGSRTCVGGKWGACVGTHVVVKTASLAGAIQTSTITQGPCPPSGPLSNPCDPYCNQIIDDDAITIAGGVVAGSCQYYEPADAPASYAAINSGWRAIRGGAAAESGPCTPGTSDSCGHDSWCPAGTGCVFFAPGEKNTACGGASWDLTFGTPCDNAGSNDVKICNRGNGPTPGAGTYWGVVTSRPLQGQPTSVSLCKAFPADVRGYCSIDFAATSIAPGACISRKLSTLCPGVDFGNSGLPGTDRTTVQWNMPDWPDPTCGNKPRVVGECDDKNNFTVFEQSAALACQGAGCGGGGGAPPGGGGANLAPIDTTANGLTSCAPNLNQDGAACGPPGYAQCKQDFRCNAATNTCVWNGGSGYFDPTAAGPDLTIGAPCGPNGAVTPTIPICNRGAVAVPAGDVLVHFAVPPAAPDPCAAVSSPFAACTVPLPAGGLPPGQCFTTTACPTPGPGAKFVTVNWGGAIAEAPGACANNVAYLNTDGPPNCAACSSCDTRVTGTVYDPSGVGGGVANNLPLAGVAVFEPSGALTPFPAGTACDTCASLDSPFVTKTVSAADGTFTLSGVTPGPATRIVVQSGRWRRTITVPVTACTNNAPAAGTFRMPRTRTDGYGGVADIPKLAVISGDRESLSCFVYRIMNSSTAEIQPRTAPSNLARIQLWNYNGMTSPGAASVGGLWAPAVLAEYTALLAPCGSSGSPGTPAASKSDVLDWLDQGGRMFVDHWSEDTLVRLGPSPLPGTSTWRASGPSNTNLSTPVRVQIGTPPQTLFADWMDAVGATAPAGSLWTTANEVKEQAYVPTVGKSVEWLRGNTSSPWSAGAPPGPPATNGNVNVMFTFETPVGGPHCGVPGGTGRVVSNSIHISATRGTSGSFPASCSNLAISQQEKALAYQFFQLTACQLGGNTPPPPPPPLAAVEAFRDFEGICPPGTAPKWGFFFWQSVTPPGTSVDFRAATADSEAALPSSPPGPAPTTVSAGTATGASIADPSWASDANTVSWHLANDPPGPAQKSKRWLRVYMKLNPIGAVPPTLTAVRQDYSCVPAE